MDNAYGSAWDLNMPYWLGIYWAGGTENGFHALPILSSGATLWAGALGTRCSFGCIVLDTKDAKWMYDWSTLGTVVFVNP
jgi:lipoprotein-anchoring transpeptidase ErfK/SrfK